MKTIHEARQILVADADPTVVAQLDACEAAGVLAWRWDPECLNTAGMIVPGTNRAAVVVYGIHRDFEVDEELLETLLAEAGVDAL